MEEMRTAGLLEPQKGGITGCACEVRRMFFQIVSAFQECFAANAGDSLAFACTSGAVLPRLKTLCAGPMCSLALDTEAWADCGSCWCSDVFSLTHGCDISIYI